MDAANYLRTRLPTIDAGFVYLDPPYYIKGAGLYQNHYSHDDHAEIASLVVRLEQPWVVSYDAVPQIRGLYDGFSGVDYSLSYSAQARYQGTELMFCRPGLRFPDVSPANVPWKVVDQARLARRRV